MDFYLRWKVTYLSLDYLYVLQYQNERQKMLHELSNHSKFTGNQRELVFDLICPKTQVIKALKFLCIHGDIKFDNVSQIIILKFLYVFHSFLLMKCSLRSPTSDLLAIMTSLSGNVYCLIIRICKLLGCDILH